jgi:hypothetical protein
MDDSIRTCRTNYNIGNQAEYFVHCENDLFHFQVCKNKNSTVFSTTYENISIKLASDIKIPTISTIKTI